MTDTISDQPLVAIDPAWPRVSLADATAALTAPGSKFEMDMATIRGIPTRVWKHAPADLGVLLDLSRTHGDRLATILGDERVSFEAQYRAAAALAQALIDRGVGKGDRIAFATRNLPEWPVIFFAIVSIGAIAVPLNAWWTGDELTYGIKDSGVRIVIVDVERCNNCRSCFLAVKDEHTGNEFPGYAASQPAMGANWLDIVRKERGAYPVVDAHFMPVMCNHCDDAPCMKVARDGAVAAEQRCARHAVGQHGRHRQRTWLATAGVRRSSRAGVAA